VEFTWIVVGHVQKNQQRIPTGVKWMAVQRLKIIGAAQI